MIQIRRLQRNGPSTCLTIPPPMLAALGLQRGDLVALAVEEGRLIARKLDVHELLGRLPAAAPGPHTR